MAKTLKQIRTLADIDAYPQTTGPRITVARENMEMSVEELAAHLGVMPASVAAWEADERTPRANRLVTMAGVLGTSLAWLLEGREDERMEAGNEPALDDLRGRIELARNLITRGLDILEGVEALIEQRAEDE